MFPAGADEAGAKEAVCQNRLAPTLSVYPGRRVAESWLTAVQPALLAISEKVHRLAAAKHGAYSRTIGDWLVLRCLVSKMCPSPFPRAVLG